jgi:hypothetical protein
LRPQPTTDHSAAQSQWIVEGIKDDSFATVKGLMRDMVTWESVATETGRELHRLVQFDSLRGASGCWFCLWDGRGWVIGSPAARVITTDPSMSSEVPAAFPPRSSMDLESRCRAATTSW